MSAAASVFPAYTEDDWRKAATAALKGAPLDKLVSKTSDGVALGPIHVAATGPRALRAASGAWKALARLDHPDAGAANEAALEDLGNGADGLQIVFAGATGAYGYGLARADSPTVLRALEGVRFDEGATFELDLGPDQLARARTFASVISASCRNNCRKPSRKHQINVPTYGFHTYRFLPLACIQTPTQTIQL